MKSVTTATLAMLAACGSPQSTNILKNQFIEPLPTSNASSNLDSMFDEIAAAGWPIEFTDDDRSALRSVISLKPNWDRYGLREQLHLVRHAMVHMRQLEAWGKLGLATRYLYTDKSWEIEVEAWRQVVYDEACLWPENTEAVIDSIMLNEYPTYGFPYEEETRDLLEEAVSIPCTRDGKQTL